MNAPRVITVVWRKLTATFGTHRLLRLMSLYPPFLGAGIRVTRISPDLRRIETELRLRPWNRNYVGTLFGGSLYAMCDPCFMLILFENLGPEYVVWDKSASIRYLRPGRGRVRAVFEVPPDRIEAIRRRADVESRIEEVFEVDVVGEDGKPVARVTKVISVRRKARRDASSRLPHLEAAQR
jgi:acyl-coenzyme A thioesterase PaaI-like protein